MLSENRVPLYLPAREASPKYLANGPRDATICPQQNLSFDVCVPNLKLHPVLGSQSAVQ